MSERGGFAGGGGVSMSEKKSGKPSSSTNIPTHRHKRTGRLARGESSSISSPNQLAKAKFLPPQASSSIFGNISSNQSIGKPGEDELSRSLRHAMQKSMEMLNKSVQSQGTVPRGHVPSVSASKKKKDSFDHFTGGYPPQWKELVDEELLCDCLVQGKDGKGFRAHRCILAAASNQFLLLFQPSHHGGRKGSSLVDENEWEEPQKVVLRNVDGESLKCIIDFAYTGTAGLNVPIAEKLLPIASRLEMLPLVQQCCRYLVSQMNPENCLRVFQSARPYFCYKLRNQAKQFILHNFRAITRTREYLELPSDELREIFADDHLNARNEAMVFEAIRSWVEHDPWRRKGQIADLLKCVRFGLMSYGYFTNVVYQWHFVNEMEEVKQCLYGPSMFLAAIDSLNNSEVDLNDPLARPRIPHEIVFAIGGWSAGSPTSFMETYDVRADRWFLSSNPDTTPRAYHGLVSLGCYIYMIGGFDGNEHFSTVRRYDPMNKIWEEKACMLNPRCYVSCCQLDGIIYACGGYNGRTRMASVEKYDPERNLWELIAPMNRQRSDASACAIKGKVYVAGGFTGTEVLNSVETYDPKEEQWTFIQPMNTARSGVALVAYKDMLYAIGGCMAGFNGFNRLNTGERYNPDEPGQWQLIPEMSSARSNFAAVSADELLICIGGFNGATTIPYVECYDSKVNEWFDASHMNLNRSALSACVVSNLPNAYEYSYIYKVQELLGLAD